MCGQRYVDAVAVYSIREYVDVALRLFDFSFFAHSLVRLCCSLPALVCRRCVSTRVDGGSLGLGRAVRSPKD